jgi:hypothetical protein
VQWEDLGQESKLDLSQTVDIGHNYTLVRADVGRPDVGRLTTFEQQFINLE